MGWLKDIREKAGQRQEDVACAVGIKRASYSNIESGKRLPSVKMAKRIAAAMGFDWTRFFEDDEKGA